MAARGLRELFAFLLLASTAYADSITNDGFETGNFTGWSTIGDTLVVDASFGTAPAKGSYQALITNAPDPLNESKHPQSYSGNNSVIALNSLNDQLSPFLGLPMGSISTFANAIGQVIAWEGSAIKQTFVGSAGNVLTFDWDYLTDEGSNIDFAFLELDGTLTLLADFSTVHAGSGTPFANESGYHIFATTLATSGTHSIGIGVVDSVIDPGINSGVLVDNFSVHGVPEPEPCCSSVLA